jgi:hypothetical protein
MGLDDSALNRFLFEHRLYTRGLRSFFLTRNSAASFSLITLFAALGLLCHTIPNRRSRNGRMFMVLAACLIIGIALGLLLTKSKGALIGLATGLMALAGWHYGKDFIRKHRCALGITVLLCLALLTWALGTYGLKHGRLPGGQSMLVRWQYWHAAGQLIREHPICGIGPGQFSYYYHYVKPPEAVEAVADPHNLVLSLLVQYGPIGLLGLMVMGVGCLRKMNTPLSMILCCGVLAVLVANLADFGLWEPSILTCFWVLVACALAHGTQYMAYKPSQASVPVKACLTLGVFVSAVLLIHFAYTPVVRATFKTQEAYKCMQKGFYSRAHGLLAEAAAIDTLSPAAPGINGRLYVHRYQDSTQKDPKWLDKAEQNLKQAIQRNRIYYKNYQRLAEVYVLKEDTANAYRMYQLAAERNPVSSQIWFELGRLAEKQGYREEAITYYTKAVHIEEAFQRQFRLLYPERDLAVNRMDVEDFRFARERLGVLSGDR